MQNLRYSTILAKIVAGWLVIFTITAVLLLFPAVVSAQQLKVSAQYNVNLQLNDDLSGIFDYNVNLQNSDVQLIQEYNLSLPFSTVEQVTASKDGQAIPVIFNKNGNQTDFTIRFDDKAVRTGQSASVKLDFKVPNLLVRKYELTQLYLPKLQTAYDITSFKLQVSYSGSFPQISYLSDSKAVSEKNKVTLNSVTGFLILWGEEAIYDVKERVNLKSSGDIDHQSIFNFIPKLADQDVIYKSITGINLAGNDSDGNIWGIADGKQTEVNYEARIHRLSKKYSVFNSEISVKYPEVSTPATLESLLSTPQTPLQDAKTIYDFAVTNYKASNDTNITRDTALNLNDKASKADSGLSNLEFATITASLLQNRGYSVHVIYGYVVTPSELGSFNTRRPHVWLELWIDNTQIVLDPYLQSLTGFNFWNTININRLEMGVWDPDNDSDSVLGILSNGLRPAPETATLGEITQSLNYELTGNFPEQVLAGENYEGKLTVVNHSGYFITLKSLTLNGGDILDKIKLTDDLVQAAFPLATTDITVNYLFEQNLLEDRTTHNKIVFTPDSELFPAQNVSYDTRFTPNQKIIVFITTVAVIGLTFLVVALAYLISRLLIPKR